MKTKTLSIELHPIGHLPKINRSQSRRKSSEECTAELLPAALEWETNKLQIKWNSIEKYFEVNFEAASKDPFPLDLGKILSTKIPLDIAKSSNCDCGSVLQLGDYSITTENDKDFTFQATYYCPECRTTAQAKTKGFKNIIKAWMYGLKKIEIKTNGIGLER